MKKVFLLLVFTGIVGAISASSIKVSRTNLGGDDKKKKEQKTDTKKVTATKTCTMSTDSKKSCCRSKAQVVAPTSITK